MYIIHILIYFIPQFYTSFYTSYCFIITHNFPYLFLCQLIKLFYILLLSLNFSDLLIQQLIYFRLHPHTHTHTGELVCLWEA